MNKKRNSKISVIVLLILTILVLFFSLKDNFYDVIKQLTQMNLLWVLVAFLLVFGYWLFSSLAMHAITKKFSKDISVFELLKINVITQFFNGVTPFSTGGQPYQVFALKKRKLDTVKSTNITIQTFVTYQVALILLGAMAVISNQIFDLFPSVKLLRLLVLLGFIVNTLVAIGLFGVAFTQKLNRFVLKSIISLGSKLHIVKDKEKTVEKFNNYVTDFHDGTKLLLENKFDFIKTIFLQVLALICVYVTPLAILYSMGDYTSFNAYIAIVSTAYVMLIGSFVPMPGGTGGLEYSFVAFYGNFITGSKLTVLMLIWRFITYYFGMIIGAITFNISRKRN